MVGLRIWICDGKAVSAAASESRPKAVFKSNAVTVEGDSIEDRILVASSEGSKISSRRKWFEKEDLAIMGGMDGGRAVKETDWAKKGAEEMAISDGADAPVHGQGTRDKSLQKGSHCMMMDG